MDLIRMDLYLFYLMRASWYLAYWENLYVTPLHNVHVLMHVRVNLAMFHCMSTLLITCMWWLQVNDLVLSKGTSSNIVLWHYGKLLDFHPLISDFFFGRDDPKILKTDVKLCSHVEFVWLIIGFYKNVPILVLFNES